MISLDDTQGPARVLLGHTLADADGRLLAVDQSVGALLHRAERDIVGMSYVDMTHPDDRSWNQDRVGMLDGNAGPITLRKRYLRPEGSAVWCEVQASRLTDGSDRGRLIGTLYRLAVQTVVRTPAELWRSARRMHVGLQARRSELGDDLFFDFPWIVLLQLYLTEAEGRCVDLVDLAVRSGVRLESIRRWLRVLEERSLVETVDRADSVVQLTATGMAKVEKLLDGTTAA